MSSSPSEQPHVLTREKPAVFSCYKTLTKWKSVRVLRIGLGMYHDVKRRYPYYWTDIRDAWTYRTVASIVRIYFIKYYPLYIRSN